MRLHPKNPFGLRRAVHTAFVALLVAGCADEGDDPFGSLLADESGGVLQLQADLPSAATWAESYGIGALPGLVDWETSWDMETTAGRGVREATYRVMVPVLILHLDRIVLEQGLELLEAALNEAEEIPAEDVPVRITQRLDLARDAQLRGALALENNDVRRAVTELLRGSDVLREVEPRHVATQLLAAAHEGMRRLLGTESYSQQTRERAQTLIRIARTAMRDGDFTRAIQSAYYATQLLEVDVH